VRPPEEGKRGAEDTESVEKETGALIYHINENNTTLRASTCKTAIGRRAHNQIVRVRKVYNILAK
jgi:hypothetical protein